MRRYSWGITELDEITGGIQSTLTSFYGETGSGKTTLCGYVPILRIAKELKNTLGEIPKPTKFIVIDGDGGFDLDRGSQIWESNGLDPEEIKGHIVYYEITEFSQQHNLVTKELEKKIEENQWKPMMIMFDPMTAIYRGIILRTDLRYRASTIGSYTGKLDLQLGTLRHLAVTFDCPCLVSTWSSSPVGEAFGTEGEHPFIGGRQFGYLPKLIVELSVPKHGLPFRKTYIYKARGRPAGKECYFKLSDAGIERVVEKEIKEAEGKK